MFPFGSTKVTRAFLMPRASAETTRPETITEDAVVTQPPLPELHIVGGIEALSISPGERLAVFAEN